MEARLIVHIEWESFSRLAEVDARKGSLTILDEGRILSILPSSLHRDIHRVMAKTSGFCRCLDVDDPLVFRYSIWSYRRCPSFGQS